MRHRSDEELGAVAGNDPRDDHDDGSVFQRFFAAVLGLIRPQVSVGQDVSGFGNRP
ncbi:MAG TPA: hypothetical protein VIZ66_02625 [Sphingomicrobium sp.]